MEAPVDISWPVEGAPGLFIDVYDWDVLVLYPGTENSLLHRLVLCSQFYPCVLSLDGVGGLGVLERIGNGSISCLSSVGCTSVSLSSLQFLCDSRESPESAILLDGSALNMSKASISRCSSISDGGAVQCYGAGSTVNIQFSSFISTKSAGVGGAISAAGCSLTILNSSFQSCSAAGGGGAFSAAQFQCYGSANQIESRVFVRQSRFEACRSISGGGAIFASSTFAKVNLIQSTFMRCFSNTSGGAIFTVDGAQVLVTDSLLQGNCAGESGGAIALTQFASVSVTSSFFSGNVASMSGGAVFLSDSNLFLIDSVAEGNVAENGGGGFVFWEGNLLPNIIEQGRSVVDPNPSMCKTGNSAGYGRCLASSYTWLQVLVSSEKVFPGLPFTVVVVKRDAYNQTISTDVASVLQSVTAIDNHYSPDKYVELSGGYITTFEAGQAVFSMFLKPSYIKVDSVTGLTVLKTRPSIYFKGIDAETGQLMQSGILQISVETGDLVCPLGYILVLNQATSAFNETAVQGACTLCNQGTYSVSPLAGVTLNIPSCLNCPSSAICKGGNDVQFSLGTWSVSEGMYTLIACPPGHQLVNSVSGVFSSDIQNCEACSSNQYILNSNNSKFKCESCPVGAECDGNSLRSLVDGAMWVGDMATGVYVLVSCPMGFEMQSASLDTQQCLVCPAASYCVGGTSPSTPCPEGTYAQPGANSSSSCHPVVFVEMVLTLPLTRDEFTSMLQANFLQAIAASSGVSLGDVTISSVSATDRRDLGASIQVQLLGVGIFFFRDFVHFFYFLVFVIVGFLR